MFFFWEEPNFHFNAIISVSVVNYSITLIDNYFLSTSRKNSNGKSLT